MPYNQPIKIQIMNDSGQWEDIGNFKARVNGAFGDEKGTAGSEQATRTINFDLPYFSAISDLDPRTTRIVFRGNSYDVTEPPDNYMQRNRSIRFRAVRRYGR